MMRTLQCKFHGVVKQSNAAAAIITEGYQRLTKNKAR